ncbi:hypothetical protein C0Q70_12168 [Pomacea canaliculata]|uniref:OTU domain-containing protein n=2 Tax=Pomacea canaliculata TaxID=400727 RepID=A0A2T7P0S0_POMCA|nr:hypothetical protein C0Q70_12168 [Pomacea canaliculata]
MSLFAGKGGSLQLTPLTWQTFHQSPFRNHELSGPSPHNSERSFGRDGVEVSTNMKLKHRRSLLEGVGFYDHFDSIFHDVALPVGSCGVHPRAHEDMLPSDGKPEAYGIPIKIESLTASLGGSPSQQTGSSRNLVGRPERSSTLPDSKCVALGEENCFLNSISVAKCLKEHSSELNDCHAPPSLKSVKGRYSPIPNFRLVNPTKEHRRLEITRCWSNDEKENVRSNVGMETDFFTSSLRRQSVSSPLWSDEKSVPICENFKEENRQDSKNLPLSTTSLRRKPLRQSYGVITARTSVKSSPFLTAAEAATESPFSILGSDATHVETSSTVLNDAMCTLAAATPFHKDADTEGRAKLHERRCCAVSVASSPPSYTVYKYLKATLASLERQVDYIRGDGNCFFRALSKEIYGSENFHAEWREAVVDVIECYPRIFGQYIDTNSMTLHVREMRRLGTWATTCEIYAAATLLQHNIYVLAPDHNQKEYRWLLFSPHQLTRHYTGGNNTQMHTQGKSVGDFCRGHSCSTSGISSAAHHFYLTLCHTNGNHYDRIMPAFVSCNCQLPPPSLDGATVLVDLTESDEDRA